MDVNYVLQAICFQWDSDKAIQNLRKHEIDLEVACETFFDPLVFCLESEIVSNEERERLIDLTYTYKLLYVVYTERDDVIRIISTRPVTIKERMRYENR
jgi:uncharacterized DUF497 family protein